MTSTGGRRRSCPPWSAPATTVADAIVPAAGRGHRRDRPDQRDRDDCWWPPISTAAWHRSWTTRRRAQPLPESMEALRSLTVDPGHGGGRGVRPGAGRPARICSGRPSGSTWSAATARRPPPRTGTTPPCSRPRTPRRLGRLRLELQQITAEYRGVRLELKPTGIAVHLRGMDPADAAAGHHADRGEPGDLGGGAPAARQDGARADRGDHQQGPRTQGPDEGEPLHRNSFHRRRRHR